MSNDKDNATDRSTDRAKGQLAAIARALGASRKVAVLRLGSVGDVLATLPFAWLLRDLLGGEARIAWIAHPVEASLVDGVGAIDEVVRVPRGSLLGAMSGWRRALSGRGIDCVVDLHGNLKSGIVARLTGAPVRIGLDPRDCREHWNPLFTTHKLPPLGSGNKTRRALEAARILGHEAPAVRFGLAFTRGERERAAALLASLPGAAGAGAAVVLLELGRPGDVRSWPAENCAALARALTSGGRRVVLLGGPGEAGTGEEVRALLGDDLPGVRFEVGTLALREQGALCSLLAEDAGAGHAFVGADSGSLHLAAACGLRSIGLFGPQDPARTAPVSPAFEALFHAEAAECIPCGRRECSHPVSQLCMKSITVEEVEGRLAGIAGSGGARRLSAERSPAKEAPAGAALAQGLATPRGPRVGEARAGALALGAAAFAASLACAIFAGGSGAEDPLEMESIRARWPVGEQLLPRRDGGIAAEFPGLSHLLPAAALHLGGLLGARGTIPAHVPAALASACMVLLTCRMARRLGGARAGILAGAALLCMWRFPWWAGSRAADPVFACAVTASLLFYLEADGGRGRLTRRAVWLAALSGGAAFVLGGLLGLLLPAAAVVTFLAGEKRPGRLFQLDHWLPALLAVAIAGSWLAVLGALGGEALRADLLAHPFISRPAAATPGEPWWAYLFWLFSAALPASALAPFAIASHLKNRRYREDLGIADRRWRFPKAALGAGLVILTLVRAKRPEYALCLFPMLAVLIAAWCDSAWARFRAAPVRGGGRTLERKGIHMLKKSLPFLAILLAALSASVLAGRRCWAATFHVAAGGDDAWSGKLAEPSPAKDDGPLASLAGARDAIRRLKTAGGLKEPVRVVVHAGNYRITEPFTLEPRDSGTADAPIVYAGEPGARAVVSGGRPITGWKRQGKLWVAEVPGVKSGAWSFGALWVNGERRTRARSPNDGWFVTRGKDPARERTAFRFQPGDVAKWRNIDDACIVVYHSWETSLHRIASIEEETSTVVFTGPAAWPFESWGPQQRYRVENVPEALDTPGEWYLDRRVGLVSYVPLEGEDPGDPARFDAVAPIAKQLVVLAGAPEKGEFVEHVAFEDLRFLHSEWALPPQGHSDGQAAASISGAVEALGARRCAFTRCEVGHVGTYGVWLRAGCQEDRIEECEVHDLGAGGVRVGETASPPSQAQAAEHNVVENCFIHDGGKIFSGGVGVWIGRSSHNRVSHCEVCDFDYTGFSVGWSWGYEPSSAHDNVLEYNHIHDIGRGVLNDMGAIYTLGVSPGTVERFNLMHDIYCHSFGGWGVYTDEGSTGILIEKNVVYNTSSGCFHQHYGKENILRNNVFAFGIEGVLRRSREEDHTSFSFERNIVLSKGTPFHIVGWSNGQYRIDSNLYWDYEASEPLFAGMSFADWRAKGRDARSLVADPLCEDALGFNFRLKPGSPAASIGFETIDTTSIGLRGDPRWVELPAKTRRGSYGPPPAAAPLEIHVSPGGSDEGQGTKEKPFATLERARRAVESIRQKGPRHRGMTVWLDGGIYPVTRSFELTDKDSGTAETPVVYRAREGETVRLLGGKRISGFKPLEDPAVLERLPAEARGKVLEADLKAQGISDFGKLRSRGFGRAAAPAHLELFFGAKEPRPMTLVRWPNEGFTRIAGAGEADPAGDGHGGKIGKLEGGFTYEGDRPKAWRSFEGVWVHGYWAWDWANTYEEVASIDTAARLIRTKPPHGIYGFRAGQRFYFLNVLEELDSPGEYFVDAARGKLYFWPPEPVEGREAIVSLLEEPLISLKDASHVAFEGMVLEGSRGPGIRVSGGEGVLVSGCTLRNLGGYAVAIEGGKGHGVEGCDIHDTGDGGVILDGGDRATLAPSRHFARGNHVHHVARWSKCYCPAFLVGGVGSTVSRNLIHDHPHCAILFNGNEHLLELNEIHHVCLETGDVGAIYTGRDWTFRGNVIRHNFIHETGGVGMGSMGVYLDDCVSGETVVGNVFWKVPRAAFIGGGRDISVENNVFVDCDPAVWIDGRGLDRSPVWRDMVEKTMKASLDAMRHHEPPYAERYPKLKELDAYYAKGEGVPPAGITVARNVVSGGSFLKIGWHAKEEMAEVRDNLTGGDPRFLDAARGDFQLREDSPAWRLGFQRIPFEAIGLGGDPCRPAAARGATAEVGIPLAVSVEVEEEVARSLPPRNGAGPLWCYGAPLLVRHADEVFASASETGEGVPPLSNTRPRVFERRDGGAWNLLYCPEGFREREPCPVARLARGLLFLSLNTSKMPPGTQYGACDPHLVALSPPSGARLEAGSSGAGPEPARPPWPADATFTDHSYRGLAADAARGEILVLNIDAKTSEQHWALRDAAEKWPCSGRLRFPIRACYPQVALRGAAAHVLAVGDIVEPVDEWRRFKKEKTGNEWDYVFRRLFYAFGPDLAKTGFREPIEVENLDATAGHIRNLDLWMDSAGAAHILYLKQPVQSALMRDRFFAGTPLVTTLVHVTLKDGAVARRETILEGGEGREGPVPGNARFHSTDGRTLFAIAWVGGSEGGKPLSENRVIPILPERGAATPIPLREPFTTFFTACERGGSEPSPALDLFGVARDGERLRYARVRLR